MAVQKKKCSICGKLKKIEEFHKDRMVADGYNIACKECVNVGENGRNKPEPKFKGKNPYRRGTEDYKRFSGELKKQKKKEIAKEIADPERMKGWIEHFNYGQKKKIQAELRGLHGIEYLKIMLQILEFSQPKISRVESKVENSEGITINLTALTGDNNVKEIENKTIDISVEK